MLGKKIQKLRKDNGLSQEELASKLTISRQAISKWELGESMPDTENVVQLSKLFKVTTDYLLNDDYETNTANITEDQESDSASGINNNEERSVEKTSKLSNLFKKKKVWIITAALVIVAVIATTIVLFMTQMRYVQVFIASPESPEVYYLLRDNNIRMQVKDSNIFVPKKNEKKAIILILENGYIPINGGEAYGFGVTADLAKEIYDMQRADDIRTQLLRSGHIADALVMVSTAEASPHNIEENKREAAVSVVLTIAFTYTLSDSDVQAIGNLIRSAVPGIKDENISITDSNLNYYPIND